MPSRDFAIEFNGIYWHSIECSTPASYHKDKTDLCEEKNIFLLHIFDIEWKHKENAVKNHIRLLLDIDIKHCNSDLVFHVNKNEVCKFFK